MLLIGSRALSYWHPEYKKSSGKDWDVICSYKEAKDLLGSCDSSQMSWKFGNVELHSDYYFLNNQIKNKYGSLNYVNVPFESYSFQIQVCSSRGLAVIKRSHLYRDFNFPKHIIQYQYLDKDFSKEDWEFIGAREKATKKIYRDGAGSKNKSNDEFFRDGVTRVVPHDEIHKAILPKGQRPIYLLLKKDDDKAAYDLELWENFSHNQKIQAIREECYVIAIERWLLPYALKGVNYPYSFAFDRALQKACTTLDNGPWREYAIDNWSEIRNFDREPFELFWKSQNANSTEKLD